MDELERRTAPGPKPRPPQKSGPRGRVSRRLVITSSAAILAVYAVGFVRTQAAADRVSAAASQFQSSQANPTVSPGQPASALSTPSSQTSGLPTAQSSGDDAPTNPTPVPTATTGTSGGFGVGNGPAPTAVPPTAVPEPSATAVTASRYRDGTYSATGVSRHGDIAAQVTVKGGKIVSTQITGCYTRYPCSRISDLPGEVINQQSTDVDMVSGATDSSEAFLQAVDNALQKALG